MAHAHSDSWSTASSLPWHIPFTQDVQESWARASVDNSTVDLHQRDLLATPTPEDSTPGTPNPFSTSTSVAEYPSGSYFTEMPYHRRHLSRTSMQSVHTIRQSSADAIRDSGRDAREAEAPPRKSGESTRSRTSYMAPKRIRRTTLRSDSVVSFWRTTGTTPKAKRMASTMLTSPTEKPWLGETESRAWISHILVYAISFLGIAAAAVLAYFTWRNALLYKGNLCLVMEDNFDTFDTEHTWTHEVSMSGFGNDEFEMTTDSANNSFVRDGRLYIVPTLTSDAIGLGNVLNGYTFNLTGCTEANATNCGAVSNTTLGTVINPVMSARLTTRGNYAIQYGRVEIRAKLPRGDWLWPALWMLPVDNAYGDWPRSGEIDIMESRGNGPEYPAQGVDYVRGSLNWGPFPWLNGVWRTFGWWTVRRTTFADGFHTYTLEWTPEFVRIYVDSRLSYMLLLKLDQPFFERGGFPQVVVNGTEFQQLKDPWADGTRNVAPFDRPFYLIMNVAVGGRNGWFPDGVGGKPWLDGSINAMRDFAIAQNTWYSTWPQNVEERAMVVDSVKMWKLC